MIDAGDSGRPPASCKKLEASEDDELFLREVRAFLESDLTPDLREAGRDTVGVHSEIGACRVWHARLNARGWIAPAWPSGWGGTGWTPRQRFLFARECGLNDAPILFASGLRALGPLLIELGTDAQRERHLPRILTGEDLWCQGFSEPGAGSDLAAISTRAERHGDSYVVTGSKIWTTGAHIANWMFALVRTARGERRQDGLTLLLIDMASPEIRIAPIRDIAGEHEFNEVFLDEVCVPVQNRVGAEGEGWRVAKRLMAYARSNNTPAAVVRSELRRAALHLQRVGVDSCCRNRLAALDIEVQAFEAFELTAVEKQEEEGMSTTSASCLKIIGTELRQRISEVVIDALGPTVVYDASPSQTSGRVRPNFAMKQFLALRAATIYSGSSEIQRDVIARSLLKS